jgi:hypothetical protein
MKRILVIVVLWYCCKAKNHHTGTTEKLRRFMSQNPLFDVQFQAVIRH